MALKPCKECKSPVSTSAKACPHCGKGNPTSRNQLTIFLIAIGLFGILQVYSSVNSESSNKTPTDPARKTPGLTTDDENKKIVWIETCKGAVTSKLKDPDSVKFQNVKFKRGFKNLPLVFGEVNSKNSYGGYGGFQRFISGGEANLTFLEEQMEPAEFAKAWKQMGGE